MNKLDLQFQIDQLRKDKMIYALESVATSLSAVISIYVFTYWESGVYFILMVPIAIIYWLYCLIGNYFRLQKIRKLESQL
jgi:hypothetical protein